MVEKTGTVIGDQLTFQFDAPRSWDNTALLGLDLRDPDVRAILENDYVKNLLANLRSYDTPGAPLTPEVKALRQLDAEASSDLSWWKKFFNPTFDLDAQRFELSPLSSFLLAHPEFLLGPASLARQAVKTVACIALQRVAPKLLAASGAALAWENFVSFMKGGKNAVNKKSGGDPKARTIPTHNAQRDFIDAKVKSGEWKKMKGRFMFEDKKGRRFAPTKEKFEFEVGKKVDGVWQHIGIMRAEGDGAGKILKEFAKGKSAGHYFK